MDGSKDKKTLKNKYKFIILSGIVGIVVGVILLKLIDYNLLRKQHTRQVVTFDNTKALKPWAVRPKIQKQKIVIDVLAHFPKLISETAIEPAIWSQVNNYMEETFFTTLPRYAPFIAKKMDVKFNLLSMVYIKEKGNVHKYLAHININSLKNFWQANLITDDRKKLIENWDAQVLQSAKERYKPKLYTQYKKLFLEGNTNKNK